MTPRAKHVIISKSRRPEGNHQVETVVKIPSLIGTVEFVLNTPSTIENLGS